MKSTPYRVLDLTDHQGMFCGYLMAHLGADVIAIEPPGGSPARFDPSHDRDSYQWQAYARGKKSLVLDLEADAGRERLAELAGEADFLLESFSRDQVNRYNLDYDTLAQSNPGLIVVSITPFGRTGPKADWPATDLTVWASSGAHIITGDADRAPVRPSVPQSFLHAGADAAGAALIALYERHRSGRGQHVDISAQQSAAQAALTANLVMQNNGGVAVQRMAGGAVLGIPIRLTWPCKDGCVSISLFFAASFDEPNKRLLQWVHECGACTMEDVETDWGLQWMAMLRDGASPEPYTELCEKIEKFTLQFTMQELFEEGISRGIYIAPTFDIKQLLDEPHFQARDYWHTLPESNLCVPGPFARLSSSPLTLLEDAPVLNSAPAEVWSWPRMGATQATHSNSDLPLAGLKVLDFMWVAAGPYFTRVLSDFGATVIKIESTTRVDTLRALPVFKDGEISVDSSVPFNTINAGKLSLTIDPSNPAGREILLELVRWADVVTESFSPKAMKGWDLDYETLKEVKPDLIMLSSCLMGQTGPRCMVPGYGNMAAAIAGFYHLTGWEDRPPAGPYGAYTDTVAPRFALVALMAAMEHHRQTGEGQYVDLSQAEAAIHFLAPAIIEYGLKGNPKRLGNRDAIMSPHGVFPADGDDAWVAIVCQDDAAWPELRDLIGLPNDEDLMSAAGRLARETELEEFITAWSRGWTAEEIQSALISAGVAAHVLQNSPECMQDPQLMEREHFISVPHASLGEFVVENSRFRLSRTPASIMRAGPELGEHNAEVLEKILGYDGDQVADAFASLALQ